MKKKELYNLIGINRSTLFRWRKKTPAHVIALLKDKKARAELIKFLENK